MYINGIEVEEHISTISRPGIKVELPNIGIITVEYVWQLAKLTNNNIYFLPVK